MSPATPTDPVPVEPSRPEPRPGTPLFVAFERAGWARRTFVDLTRPGDGHGLERLERHFALSLRAFRAIDAALREAAEANGQAAATWLSDHDRATSSDPLLRYLLDAPDLNPDDPDRPTLLTWSPDIQRFEMRIIDMNRVTRFYDHGELVRFMFRCETDEQLFRKVAEGVMPSLRRIHKSGADLLCRYETLHLRIYALPGDRKVLPPAEHAGGPLPPTAAAALDAAIGWFEAAGTRLAALGA